MRSFLIALQFLTVIPVTQSTIATEKQLGYSCLFYPVVGLLIGCLLFISTFVFANSPVQTQSILVLIVWVLVTGGLHLDGLADCADAWVGGLENKQRSLDIMKDPAAGPIAVIVLILMLFLKWSIISYVLENQAIEVLILTPMLGRLAILILMLTTDYIRSGGLGEKLLSHLPQSAAKVILLFGLLIGVYYLGWMAIAFMLIMIFIIAYQANKRLGGVTGDVYGAAVELVEASVLLGIIL